MVFFFLIPSPTLAVTSIRGKFEVPNVALSNQTFAEFGATFFYWPQQYLHAALSNPSILTSSIQAPPSLEFSDRCVACPTCSELSNPPFCTT
ncbi:hypothetical protein QBC34DRAFT_103822 [Podospora aff. communis PSN243]|uniref:Secreted protein n=1 Tax=Podospora aff. communis PSN243 TaxID=3040156 RepID=A0AAV9H3X2_9PEZI|nr:hypothetical protein QBC34DRAFT_103822 [Podospora aff. communis PSN243]